MNVTFMYDEPELGISSDPEIPQEDRRYLSMRDDRTEQVVIGSALLDPGAADRVCSRCQPAYFWRNHHKAIMQAILDVRAKHHPVELLTVAYDLRGKDEPDHRDMHSYKPFPANLLDAVGGAEYLMACIGMVTTTAHVNVYVHQLLELYERRTAFGIQHGAYGEESAREIADRLREVRDALRWGDGARPIAEYPVLESIERHVARREFDHKVPHFDIRHLDQVSGGLPCPGYVVVMGDSGMGKTALALQIAHHWSLTHGEPSLYFSLEMDAEAQLIPRLAHLECGRGASTEEELLEAGTHIICSPLVIDCSSRTLEQIVAESRRLARDPAPRLIVLDYAGLVQTATRCDERERLQRISLECKALAKQVRSSVISISQVTWDSERRDASTFGSRGSEFDADMVVEVRRPGQTAFERRQSQEAEVYIRKNRNGPVSSVRTAFMGLRFREKSSDDDGATHREDGWWVDAGGV